MKFNFIVLSLSIFLPLLLTASVKLKEPKVSSDSLTLSDLFFSVIPNAHGNVMTPNVQVKKKFFLFFLLIFVIFSNLRPCVRTPKMPHDLPGTQKCSL